MISYSINGEVRWANTSEAADHFEAKAVLAAEIMALRKIEFMAAGNGAPEEIMSYVRIQMGRLNRKIIAVNRKSKRMGWFNIDDHTYSESRNYEARTRAQRAQDWKDTQKAGASA